jgi:metal-sulfur cluster biosynthetic enzyme
MINANPTVVDESETHPEVEPLTDPHLQMLREEVYDAVSVIKDPEHPYTLAQLKVVQEGNISVSFEAKNRVAVDICIVPTVPHCTLVSMIGLCICFKLQQEEWSTEHRLKFFISIKEGAHNQAEQYTKQLNDKERVLAALENFSLRREVERLCAESSFRD